MRFSVMATVKAKRRGHGGDAIYFAAAKNRRIGAVSSATAASRNGRPHAGTQQQRSRDEGRSRRPGRNITHPVAVQGPRSARKEPSHDRTHRRRCRA
jgi:hypothetical protein